jgi:hypothetical protein
MNEINKNLGNDGLILAKKSGKKGEDIIYFNSIYSNQMKS